MKLLLVPVACCLLALVLWPYFGSTAPVGEEPKMCPPNMENRKCISNKLNSFPKCKETIAEWEPCRCRTGFTCMNQGVPGDCAFTCKKNTGAKHNGDMSYYAVLNYRPENETTTVPEEEGEA